MDPLSSHFQDVNLQIWLPGTDLAGDEIMIQYDGRSKEKTHIPNKPHPDGIKVWALAQSGFLLCWNYHTPGESNGPVDTRVPVELGGSKGKGTGGNLTQAVIAKMFDRLPKPGDSEYLPPKGGKAPYHGWLDNLFTSTRFCKYMRSKNIAISGTARLNAGIVQPILDAHKEDKGKSGKADKLAWGTTLSEATPDGQVCQVAWKDSSLVTFMSTAKDGLTSIETLRTRPKQRKKKEEQKHKPFKGQVNVVLKVPDVAFGYNNNMGSVDNFDHLTAMNSGLRRERRGASKAVEHWLLRGVLVNTYVVAQIWRRENELVKLRSQPEWRNAIIDGLLEASLKVAQRANPFHLKERISHRKRPLPDDEEQGHVEVNRRQQNCFYCAGGRPLDRPTKRVALGVLPDGGNRIKERNVTRFGCAACNIALCSSRKGRKRGCFAKWHTEGGFGVLPQ